MNKVAYHKVSVDGVDICEKHVMSAIDAVDAVKRFPSTWSFAPFEGLRIVNKVAPMPAAGVSETPGEASEVTPVARAVEVLPADDDPIKSVLDRRGVAGAADTDPPASGTFPVMTAGDANDREPIAPASRKGKS